MFKFKKKDSEFFDLFVDSAMDTPAPFDVVARARRIAAQTPASEVLGRLEARGTGELADLQPLLARLNNSAF